MGSSASFPKRSDDGVRYPPLDGSLFLLDMIEFNAKHNPTRPLYTFYDERADDLCHVSHLEFYRACQRIAHVVRPNRQGADNAVVAVIANCDTILYQALMMGVVFAGLIPFPMSPRNSPAAVIDMMRKTGCNRLIATRRSLTALLDGIRTEWVSRDDAESPIAISELTLLAYVYPKLGRESASTPFVPYPKAGRRPAEDAVMFYLHSSGSTGFPKPIPISYLTGVHWCTTPSVQQHINFPMDVRVATAQLPPFHTIGLYMQLFHPIPSLKSVSVFAPTSYHDPDAAPVVPNAQNAIENVQRTKSTALVVVPAFLQEWAALPHAVQVLSMLEYVVFGGGPLAKKTGDALVAAGVKLSGMYGATEVCAIAYSFPTPAERALWEWVRFGPNQRIRWAPQGDGTYECQVLRCPTHHVSVENLPDVRGYATADVFIKHPTIEGLYKVVGRLDDVLVHTSGEKTVPGPMETLIGSNLLLAGVCMFGRGRSLAGVLVEPQAEYAIDVADEGQVAAFRNEIWQDVEAANSEAPAFSRIFKEMILVTSKGKPMLRVGKGTVMKKATMRLYEAEIDALYASVEASAKAGIDVPLPVSWTQIEVEDWLMAHATAVNGGKAVRVDVDVFDQGFDSLSSTFLKNRILGSLGASLDEHVRGGASRIGQNIVFANPTLRQLARHVIECVVVDGAPAASADPKGEIEDMIARYAVGLGDDDIDDGAPGGAGRPNVVLLTGSTGGLGSYLLATLLARADVSIAYAFNRPSKTRTIQERQRAVFEDRRLDAVLLDSEKLVYIEGDAAEPNLSLDAHTYAEIRDSVTVIIHNAWRVDFNLGLSSFEGNVQGTRHLIDLARASKWAAKPRFLFVSSVSSAQGWDVRKGLFPEEVQSDAGVAVGAGYGASKYVAERILAMSGLPATSFRIGQITGGAPRGAWSTSDWVPVIVQSSVALGTLPEARGVVSWLPPQAVCGAMLDVAFADGKPPVAMNVVHPQPVAWKDLMESVRVALYEKCLTRMLLPMLPFSQWVAQACDSSDMKRVPAVKLGDFLRRLAEGDEAARSRESELGEMGGMARFATEVGRGVSETMRTIRPLSGADAVGWVDYWADVGMFDNLQV